MHWVVELEEGIQTMLEPLVVAEVGAVECRVRQLALLVAEDYSQQQHLLATETLGVHQLLVEEVALRLLVMVEAAQVVLAEVVMVL